MQIISNNCLGGFIYKDILCQKYTNPFIWCKIKEQYFISLLENLYNINFNNFELKKNGSKLTDGFHISIENKIILNYTHFHFDKRCDKPKVKGISVYYNKIWEYIVDKYKKRLNRFNLSDDICIALEDYPQCPYNVNKIINIAIKNNWKIIVITRQKIDIKYDKLLVLYHFTDTNRPKIYKEHYKNEIKNFLLSAK
ncbi:MAG: DUF1919 domain-containing protein [Methanobrevibacter sp.]|nr:DUF1919 domain-containing protein [Methanobrevibacter sp.]